MREPWGKQPRESVKAFEAFELYLKLGAERSIKKVARKLGKSEALISRWSAGWGWVDRVAEWDTEQAKERLRIHEAELLEMTKRHIKIARGLQAQVLAKLNTLLDQQGRPTGDIHTSQIAQIAEVAARLERLSMGLHSEKVAIGDSEETTRVRDILRDKEARELLDKAASRLGMARDTRSFGGEN